MSNYIICVKGISGSGKSTRVFVLLKFLREVLEFKVSDFYINDTKGKRRAIGYLVEELNLVIIGKEYKSGDISRFQGLDVQTGAFGSNSAISDFLKENSSKHNFIIEGAGTTQSHRFRPKFLHEYCGFDMVYMQYYNYGGEENREEYYNRIVYRSGKRPIRDTMWNKEKSYTKEVSMSEQEKIDLGKSCEVIINHDLFNSPIEDFGTKFIEKFIDVEIVPIFKDYVKEINYIETNKFENFNKEVVENNFEFEETSNTIDESALKEIKLAKVKVKTEKFSNNIQIGRYCELNSESEVSDLELGMDFREPKFRREVFLRFYEFHLKYRSHPGAVYYLFPYIWNKFEFTTEQKLWWCFINGCTQNPATTWVVFNEFPIFEEIDQEYFEKWHSLNWKLMDFDTDRRYQKGHFFEMYQDYVKNLHGKSQEGFFNDICSDSDKNKNFDLLWDIVRGSFKMFGRLSTFSYLEYLKIAGVNINCSNLFMFDMDGSKSHRNGIAKVLGRDDLDWHKDNVEFKGYSKEAIYWLEKEAEILLNEAKLRFKDESFIDDVNYFTLESTLCCYKSWHRVDRRYPNVYNDMLFQRLKKAETLGWKDIDFDIFWEARKDCLPKHLRLEDNVKDPTFIKGKLHPEKQNHYRLTGEVIMMDEEFECFKNKFNDKIK